MKLSYIAATILALGTAPTFAADQINPAIGADASPAGSVQPLSTADARQLQEHLNKAGYSVSVDGIMGPRTTSALKQFQRSKGLAANGNLDASTYAALGINQSGSSVQGSTATSGSVGSTPSNPPSANAPYTSGPDMSGTGTTGGSR